MDLEVGQKYDLVVQSPRRQHAQQATLCFTGRVRGRLRFSSPNHGAEWPEGWIKSAQASSELGFTQPKRVSA
ncbi:MAG: hypothetical protein ACREOZ_02100 [Gloeomargaritales cyanobacterium]